MPKRATCSSCASFPRAALEADGQGQCEAYERPAEWSDGFCVLYNRATDVAARRPLVAKLMEQETNSRASA